MNINDANTGNPAAARVSAEDEFKAAVLEVAKESFEEGMMAFAKSFYESLIEYGKLTGKTIYTVPELGHLIDIAKKQINVKK